MLYNITDGLADVIYTTIPPKMVKAIMTYNVYISHKSCSAQLHCVRLMPLDNLLSSKVPLNNRALVDAATQT